MRASRMLFAITIVALGTTGLVNGDFALAWQHIPFRQLPGETVLAYICALIEVAVGVGLLLRPTLRLASGALFLYLLLWLVLLELPAIAVKPRDVGSWGTTGEIAIITAGAWCLFASHAGDWIRERLKFAVGARGIRAARLLLLISLPLIAFEVIVDTARIGDQILPEWLAWLPYPAGWAYLSGAGSLATFLAMVFGIFPRLALIFEATMLWVITIAYWGPDLYTGRTATTAFIVSAAIASGVWLVADTYREVPWLARGRTSRGISLD
jgi:hypothetical protein